MMKKALAIWAAGVVIRLILAFGFGRVDTGWTEVQLIARSLLEKGEFADPYRIPTGPTSHTAPAYPAIQAVIFKAFGYGIEAEHARIALSILLAGLEYALLPWLSVRLGFSRWAGLVAGWGGALVPLHYWGEAMGIFENTLAALLLLVFTGLAGPQLQGSVSLTKGRAALLGALGGGMMLVSPALLLPVAAATCVAGWRGTARAKELAVSILCAAALMSPWLIRNRIVFGGWSFVRGEFGLELSISNFEGATADAQENLSSSHFRKIHPIESLESCERIKQVGERQFYRERLLEATQWIRENKAEFIRLATRRLERFWVPYSQYGLHRVALALVLLMAIGGWVAAGRAATPLVLIPLAYSVMALLVHTAIRYSHPVWWDLCLSAGVAVKWAHDKLKTSP